MAEKVIDIPGVGPTAFPDSMSDAEVNAAATRVYQGANPSKKQPPVSNWVGAATAAAGAAMPAAANLAAEIGTNPAVPKMVGAATRTATTLGMLGQGIASGNLGEVVGAAPAGWQAGKGGYFLGKGIQAVARPVSTALEAAAPFTKTAGIVQGALDLAQMAEPNRKDIGTLGVTIGDKKDPQHPALVNLLLSKASEGVSKLVDKGLSAEDALAAWLKGKR